MAHDRILSEYRSVTGSYRWRSIIGPHPVHIWVDLYWVPNKPVPKRTGNKVVSDLIRSKVFSVVIRHQAFIQVLVMLCLLCWLQEERGIILLSSRASLNFAWPNQQPEQCTLHNSNSPLYFKTFLSKGKCNKWPTDFKLVFCLTFRHAVRSYWVWFKSNKSEIIENYEKAEDWCCDRMWKSENGLTQ